METWLPSADKMAASLTKIEISHIRRVKITDTGLNYKTIGYLREMEVAGRIWETFPALTACFTRPPAARPAAPNILSDRVKNKLDIT